MIGTRRRWAPEVAIPLLANAGELDEHGRATSSGGTCRVCGATIVDGDRYLHLRWAGDRAHAECGWLTQQERSALEGLVAGVQPIEPSALAHVFARGYVRRPRVPAWGHRYEITDAGKRALERGW